MSGARQGSWRSVAAACALGALLAAVGCQEKRKIEQDPVAVGMAHLTRAQLYIERGELDKASADLAVATRLLPDSAGPLIAVAAVHEAKGEFQDAVEAYRAAIALDSSRADAHFQIGLISKRARRDLKTALARFRRAYQLDSTQVEFAYQLGDTYHDLEMFAQAKRFFERAIALDPNHAYAHYGLGEILDVHMERHEEGFSEYERAIAVAPKDPDLRRLVGKAYAENRRYAEAERHLREFLRMAPNSPAAPEVRAILRSIGRGEGVSP